MIKIYIFADSHKHFSSAISEYIKRLGKNIEVIELKPIKKWNPEQIITSETQILREKLEKEQSYKVILSPKGKNISTEQLANLIQDKKNSWEKISYIIGWANGLDYRALKDIVDFEMSFGAMTFPHSLAFLLLLEQIYRCSEIEKGSGYHK